MPNGPCARRNPHTPHGTCPGSASEFPWEPTEIVADTSHVAPGCICKHDPGQPCDAYCPVHNATIVSDSLPFSVRA